MRFQSRSFVFLQTVLVLSVAGQLWLRLAAAAFADPEKDLSRLSQLEIFQPGEPSLLYSDQNEPFAHLGFEFRIFVPLASIPPLVRKAILDAEDAQFYEHGAISLKGMARAAIRNLTAAAVKEGGSTITQQLAKVLFLTPERTVGRKLREIQLATEIERQYSKDKILEMYLNAIYFGEGSYGLEAAARTYFSKSVRELSLAEAALLAGLPKAPTTYSPFNNRKRAKQRRNYVLTRMQKEGHITALQAKVAMSQPITLRPFFRMRGIAPFFVDFVRKQLEPKYGRVTMSRGSLRVYTTLNLEDQKAAVEVLRNGIREIETSTHRDSSKPSKSNGPLEGALVALDPNTGEIRAMVGGVDYRKSQFNRAAQARRQPGSAFKPFLYAAAFDRGYSPTDLLDDRPVTFPTLRGDRVVEWSPDNFDGQFRGLVTLRTALEESINVPTVRLLESLGIDPVVSLAERMGIQSELRRDYSLALGTSEVSLVELVSAYGVFANRGIRFPPTAIRGIVSGRGDILEINNDRGERVLREEIAFLITDILEGAVERGTGKRARVPGLQAAGKTGTSQDVQDAWFVGYTPALVAGVWVGFDRPQPIGFRESGGRLAAPVWAAFMKRVSPRFPREIIPVPDGVIQVLVNRKTGLPTDSSDPQAITEFLVRSNGSLFEPSPTGTGWGWLPF